MNLNLVVSFTCLLFGNIYGDPIDFTDCGSKYELKSVSFDGCKVIPCNVQIGHNYKLHLELKPTFKADTFTQEVFILAFDVHFEAKVTPDDPCESFVCPVQISDGKRFSADFSIPRNLVPTKGELKWKIKTDKGDTAVCFQTALQLSRFRNIYHFQKSLIDEALKNATMYPSAPLKLATFNTTTV